MEMSSAAQSFAAIGSQQRLEIVRVLVRAGDGGLAVGEIAERTGLAASTLTHHLQTLVGSGLVSQTREGRTLRCRAAFDALHALAGFILTECCADQAVSSACAEERS